LINVEFFLNDLCKTLGRLAAPAEEQIDYLIQLGTYPLADELALEFNYGAIMAPQLVEAGALNESQARILHDLDRMLKEMSGIENAPLWQADSLRVPIWDEVRILAREALVGLNCGT